MCVLAHCFISLTRCKLPSHPARTLVFAAKGAVDASLRAFLMKDTFAKILTCTVNPRFDFRDAGTLLYCRALFGFTQR